MPLSCLVAQSDPYMTSRTRITELLPQSSSSWSILQRHCYSLEYVSLGSSSRPDEVHSQNFHNWSPGQVKRLRQGVACSSSRKKKAKVSCCWRPTSTANCCGASVRTSRLSHRMTSNTT